MIPSACGSIRRKISKSEKLLLAFGRKILYTIRSFEQITERIKSIKKANENNKLALQMLVAMVSGILVGLGFMAIRESVGADSALWSTINSVLFQNISAAGGEQALGLYHPHHKN